MKKLSILCVSILFAFSLAEKPRFEYDIHYGFGASETGLGNVAGFAATFYPFTNNFGFSVGVEYLSKEKKRWLASIDETQHLIDNEGDELVFRYRLHNFEEKRSAKVLQIPALFRYIGEFSYGSAGFKIGIPLTTEIRAGYSELITEGYYPEVDYNFTDIPFQSLGHYYGGSFKTKFASDILFVLAVEYGARFEVFDKYAIMLGVFAERAVNDGFSKDFGSKIERVENGNEAVARLNNNWKSWNPWSVGVQFKVSLHSLASTPQL
ncbi:MAG: hypothetical protein FWC26_07025 [Fibromonadales bacterium]|nr:hypothetical protein [Fibromonadales bacterium]